jgi:hypothetical protein
MPTQVGRPPEAAPSDFYEDPETGDIYINDVLFTPGGGGSFDLPTAIHAATSKATPVNADEIPLADSAASFGLKKLTWANLKATLKTYFDTLYTATGTALQSVVAGTGISVDNTDPANPIVAVDTGVTETYLLKAGPNGEPVESALQDSGGNLNYSGVGSSALTLDVDITLDAGQTLFLKGANNGDAIGFDISSAGITLIGQLPTSNPAVVGRLYTVDASAVIGIGAILLAVSEG